ncbi:hypothetical protein HMPREF1375_01746, partial [Enterococcus faecium P1986]
VAIYPLILAYSLLEKAKKKRKKLILANKLRERSLTLFDIT